MPHPLHSQQSRPVRKRLLIPLALLALAALAAGARTAAPQGPDRRGARVVAFTVHSKLVGRNLHELAVIPPGATADERRPLLVFLHGRGGHPGDIFGDGFYAELARLGTRAPVVVEVDGGDHSYYHDRRSGRWGSYVTRELIPQAVRHTSADPRRVAIGGISMGGFGAFDVARLNPRRFCAVGGHSPAIWQRAGETAPGAFDGAADFRRHDIVRYARTASRPFRGARLWLDRGDRDPFRPGDAAFVGALRANHASITSRTYSGGHDGGYWSRNIRRYLRFYAAALARCQPR